MSQYRRTFRSVLGLFAAAVMLFAASDLSAQQTAGKIEGTVSDPTGQPVAGAQVFIVGTAFAAVTNESGYYFINNVPSGTYNLRAQFIGYQPAEVQGARVFAGQTLTVNFGLSGAVALEAIVVSVAEQPIVPRDQVTSKSIIRGQDVAGLPVDDGRAVLVLQPGVVESGSGLGVSIRGGRPGEAVIYVDGVPVRRLRTGGSQLNLATNTVEEASVITGALGAEFGDAQSGVISLVTRTGGPDYRGSFSYETDEMFGNSVGVGFNRFEGTLSGPIAGNLTFFVGGTLTGQQSGFQGKGFEDIPTYVRGPVAQSVSFLQGSDSVTVDIPEFIQYSGQCNAADNGGFECQGRRLPFNWNTGARANGKLSYTYGSGSRVSASALFDQDQGRGFPGGNIFNPDAYTGTRTSSQVYVVNWVQQVFRSADRELAFDLNLSYQTDKQQFGILDRDYELNTRDPFMGISLSPVDFVYDFDHFSDDTGDRAVRQLKSQADWDQLVNNTRLNQGTRVPLLDRDDLRNNQAYRMNPWGVAGGAFPTGGVDQFLALESERRIIGRLNVDWQFDRFNRLKFGGEFQQGRLNVFRSGMLRQSFAEVYTEDPVRYAAYAQDRLDLGDVVLELGIRWDYFDSKALFPIVPGRIFTHPDFNPANPTAQMRRADSHSSLSPRIRVSFPVTDRTNFRLSYAHQTQTPEAQAMLNGKNNDLSVTNTNDQFGGDVDFGKTIIFEFGIRHAFSQDLALDISAYNKDKAQDFAYRILPFDDPLTQRIQNFNVLTNADFGNSRGIDVGLIGRYSNWFSGSLAYTVQQSKGTGSNPFSYLNTQSRQISAITGDRLPPAQANLRTDQDRTHNISGSLAFNFPDGFAENTWYGPIIENGGVFARFRVVSGLPYTRLENLGNGQVSFGGTGFGLVAEREDDNLNASSLPWTKFLDIRVTRGFTYRGTQWNVFADIRNLLNFTNTLGLFAETGDIVNEEFERLVIDPELGRLENEAGGRLTTVTKEGASVRAVDLRGDCRNWAGQGGVVDCLLLQGVEARFGNGDGFYDRDEQTTALTSWYQLNNGSHSFFGSPRHIRLGVEMTF